MSKAGRCVRDTEKKLLLTGGRADCVNIASIHIVYDHCFPANSFDTFYNQYIPFLLSEY